MAKKNHTLGKVLAITTTVAAIGGACYIFRDKIRQSAIYQKSADKLSGLFGKKSDEFIDDDDFFFDDEDDIFSDDTIFSDDSINNREYTSITINAKQEEDVPYSSPLPDAEPEESIPAEDDSISSATEDNSSTITEATDIPETEVTDTPEADAIDTLETDVTDTPEADATASPLPEENDLSATEETTDTEEAVEEVTEIFADEAIPTITFGGGFGTPVSTPEPPTTPESDSSENENKETVTEYEYEGLSDTSEDPDVLEEQDKLDF